MTFNLCDNRTTTANRRTGRSTHKRRIQETTPKARTPKSTRPARPAPKCCVNSPDLDPKKPGEQLLPLKKMQDLCVNNAINERQKKKTKAPENRKRQSPKVLRNSPKASKPEASKDTGSPERIAPADSRPTQTASHKPSAKKSRLASLGKRLNVLRTVY